MLGIGISVGRLTRKEGTFELTLWIGFQDAANLITQHQQRSHLSLAPA